MRDSEREAVVSAPAARCRSGWSAALVLLIVATLGVRALRAAEWTEAVRRAASIPWEPRGLSGGGGMFAPAISPVDPDWMLVNCDMSGAYISRDGGRNWEMIHAAQLRSDTRCRPAFHPHDRNVIFASSGGRLRISRDGGHTFVPLGDLRDTLAGEIAIDPRRPDRMLVGTRTGRCYCSHDGGQTWSRCPGPEGEVLGFRFHTTDSGTALFAATRQGIWRSDDDAQSWALKTAGLPWLEIQGFAGGASPTGAVSVLYCTVRSKLEQGRFVGGVYRSDDGGQRWQPVSGTGLNTETERADQWAFGSLAQYEQILTSDADPHRVYVWNTSTGFHPPHHETCYRSDDGGRTWRDVYFMDPRFEKYNVAPNYVTASTHQSWKGGDAPFGVAICRTDPERMIVVRNRCQVTHDGGTTWFNADTRPATAARPGPGSPWLCTGLVVTTTWHYYVDRFEPQRHFIAYTDIGFARSLDGGRSWIWWDPKSWAPWRNTCYEIAFDPEIPGKMWGAFSDVHDIPNDNIISERHGHERPGGVCMSVDYGATWQPAGGGLPPRPVTSIVVDPASPRDARTLYAGVFMEGVYKSTDDGRTWTLKKDGLGHARNMRVYRVLLHADKTLFAVICAKRPAPRQPLMPEGVGVYRSRDGGDHWEHINGGNAFLYPKDLNIHPTDSRQLLLGTCDASGGDQSGGLYRTRDGGQAWERIGRQGRQTFGGTFHPRFPGWIYMTLTEGAPGAGLWLSQDDGRTWLPFADLPFSNIQRVAFDPQDDAALVVTTFGGSVWHGPIAPHPGAEANQQQGARRSVGQ